MNSIKSHPALASADVLSAICNPLNDFGITNFYYSTVDMENNFTTVGTNPKFAEYYMNNELYNRDIHIDPNVDSVDVGEKYILWDVAPQVKIMERLAEEGHGFGAHHLFTIIQTDHNKKHYFHFASSESNHNINEFYLNNIDKLKSFIFYFKDKLFSDKELCRALEMKFKINNGTPEKRINEPKKTIADLDEIKKFYIGGISDNALSRRELECVKWLLLGKSTTLIGEILGISKRTVEQHVSKVKEKLNCYTMFQLGAAVERYGLIETIG